MAKQESSLLQDEETVTTAERRRRVVIRFAHGQLIRGYLSQDIEQAIRSGEAEPLEIETPSGECIAIRPSEIKAVFLVKSFEGSRDYSEFKVFPSRPTGKGVWVRAHFRDGEILEGIAPNRLSTYSQPVFYMTPPDPSSNNQAVLVSKSFLAEMQVLGLASDPGRG